MSRKPRPLNPILNIVKVFTLESWVSKDIICKNLSEQKPNAVICKRTIFSEI